jgi:bifunctional non-homologous end joining protein LigD
MALSRSGFVEPCLPTPARSIPVGELWVHEIKHDGCRLMSRRDGDRVRLFTRRGNDWTERLPPVADALRAMPVSSVTVDGEIVATDAKGVTDFDRLRSTLSASSQEAFLYAFGILELDGEDLRRRPLAERRRALARLLRSTANSIVLSEHMAGPDGEAMFRHACTMGLEGIVCKRLDRPYTSGRSRDWIEVKNPKLQR